MNGLSFGLIAKIDVCSNFFPFAQSNGLICTQKQTRKKIMHIERRCDKNVAVSNMVYEKKNVVYFLWNFAVKKRLVNQTL